MKFCYLLIVLIGFSCSREEKEESSFQVELQDKFIVIDTIPDLYRDFFDTINKQMTYSSPKVLFHEFSLASQLLATINNRTGNNRLAPLDVFLLESKVQNLFFDKYYYTVEKLLNDEDYVALKTFRIPHLMGSNAYLTIPQQRIDNMSNLVREKLPANRALANDLNKLTLFSPIIGKKIIENEVEVETFSGDQLSLKPQLSSGKKTVLLFGASWCSPCLKNDLLLTRWYPNIDTSKVTFINISIDKNRNAWKNILKMHDYPFQNYLLDIESKEGKSIYHQLRLNEGVPKIFLLDERLNLLAFHTNIIHILRNIPEAVVLKSDFY